MVITGGASGIGELLANTLAVRNVTVVVLDVNPIVTENCKSPKAIFSTYLTVSLDNVAYYKCDVSKWEEVEAVSKKIIEEVGLKSCCLQRLNSVQIGEPTILINNAGVVQGKLIVDLTPQDIQQ